MPTPLPLSFPPEAVPLLLDWYRTHKRDLPWRENRDPYRVLVSEIMLQQTRAETVKPYFARFLERLPTVADLAAADDDTILKLWEGLGYYSRVRNLRRAAQTVMTSFGGVIPASFAELLSLPGVGRYTAGAVASIAYDLPVPAVDGNVLRVAARLTGDDHDVMEEATKRAVEAAIAPVVPSPGAGDFTQSLIELGALVCLPGQPDCASCPLSLLCAAHAEGRESQLPVRGARTARRTEELTVLVLITRGEDGGARVLLRRRPDTGLLAGLYEFPHVAGTVDGESLRASLCEFGLRVSAPRVLPAARHLFTHVEWRMTGFAAEITAGKIPEGWFTAALSGLKNEIALPSAFRVYRRACMDILSSCNRIE